MRKQTQACQNSSHPKKDPPSDNLQTLQISKMLLVSSHYRSNHYRHGLSSDPGQMQNVQLVMKIPFEFKTLTSEEKQKNP